MLDILHGALTGSAGFFTSLREAKEMAEKNRVQGTQFAIAELPSIVVRTGHATLVITETDTLDRKRSLTPLAGYSKIALQNNHPTRSLIEGARESYIECGVDAHHLVLSFEKDSRFWTADRLRYTRKVITLHSLDPVMEVVPLGSDECHQLISRSVGTQYCLRWHVAPRLISDRAIKIILGPEVDDVT
jgi:hypothetical protein